MPQTIHDDRCHSDLPGVWLSPCFSIYGTRHEIDVAARNRLRSVRNIRRLRGRRRRGRCGSRGAPVLGRQPEFVLCLRSNNPVDANAKLVLKVAHRPVRTPTKNPINRPVVVSEILKPSLKFVYIASARTHAENRLTKGFDVRRIAYFACISGCQRRPTPKFERRKT